MAATPPACCPTHKLVTRACRRASPLLASAQAAARAERRRSGAPAQPQQLPAPPPASSAGGQRQERPAGARPSAAAGRRSVATAAAARQHSSTAGSGGLAMDLHAFPSRAAAACGPSGRAVAPGTSGAAEPTTGTTIVACRYKDGVVLGADGRVSTGQYISNRASNKITSLTDSIYLLRSGSAADTQAVGDYVRYFTEQLSSELGREPSVLTVANTVAQMNYNNKGTLVGAMLVAGYDKHKGGQVYGIPIGGTMVEESWAIDGSGSTYIWGYMDAEWKPDMTREEAEAFVVEAVALAMARDASSGGVIRTVTLDQHGAKLRFISGNDVPVFHEELPVPAAASMVVG